MSSLNQPNIEVSYNGVPPQISDFINQGSNRDADKQFFGYIYQYALTLYHILNEENIWNDGSKGDFYIENKEDYLRYSLCGDIHKKDLVQVKHLSASNFTVGTARKAILKLYDCYLKSKHLFNENKYQIYYYHKDAKPIETGVEDFINDIFSIRKLNEERDTRIGKTINKIQADSQVTLNKEKILEYLGFSTDLDKTSVSPQLLADLKKENVKKELESLKKYLLEKKQEIDKISEILIQTNDYENFSKNIVVAYSGSYEEVKNNIKTILKDKFDIKDNNTENFNYNSLIGYLVTFKHNTNDYINHSKVAEYIENCKSPKNIIHINSIIGIVLECLAETQKDFNLQLEEFLIDENEDIEKVLKAKSIYIELSLELESFFIDKLNQPELRESFLKTISIKKENLKFDNLFIEYETFLRAYQPICDYIKNLLKIGYYYKLNNESIKINDVLVVDSEAWLLKPINKSSQPAVIMQNYNFMDGTKEIANTAKHFEEITNTPDCWLFKTTCKDRRGNTIQQSNYCFFYEGSYLQDITKPQFSKSSEIAFDNPDKRFRIECLECLNTTNSIDDSNTSNLFQERCVKNV